MVNLRLMGYVRGQAALELIINYWWMILIISIVLVLVGNYAIFNGPPPSLCDPVPGYSCGTPVITTTGLLSFTLQQNTGATEYGIGLACTKELDATGLPTSSSGTPYQVVLANGLAVAQTGNLSDAIDLQSGIQIRVTNLQCYNETGQKVGKPKLGTSWAAVVFLNYTPQGPAGGVPTKQAPNYVQIFSFTAPVK